MRYRIKRFTVQGHSVFIPQRKILWWWEDVTEVVICVSMKEAREYINNLLHPVT